MKFVMKNNKALTSSMYSGSEAEASQRLFRMKMLGFERRSFTLWKKCFSFEEGNTWGRSEYFYFKHGRKSAEEKIPFFSNPHTNRQHKGCLYILSYLSSSVSWLSNKTQTKQLFTKLTDVFNHVGLVHEIQQDLAESLQEKFAKEPKNNTFIQTIKLRLGTISWD